jgi:hypothetical protein
MARRAGSRFKGGRIVFSARHRIFSQLPMLINTAEQWIAAPGKPVPKYFEKGLVFPG